MMLDKKIFIYFYLFGILFSSERYLSAKLGKRLLVVDLDKKKILQIDFHRQYSQGVVFKKDGKLGFLRDDGEKLFAAYDLISPFSDYKYFYVKKDNQFGVVSLEGKWILKEKKDKKLIPSGLFSSIRDLKDYNSKIPYLYQKVENFFVLNGENLELINLKGENLLAGKKIFLGSLQSILYFDKTKNKFSEKYIKRNRSLKNVVFLDNINERNNYGIIKDNKRRYGLLNFKTGKYEFYNYDRINYISRNGKYMFVSDKRNKFYIEISTSKELKSTKNKTHLYGDNFQKNFWSYPKNKFMIKREIYDKGGELNKTLHTFTRHHPAVWIFRGFETKIASFWGHPFAIVAINKKNNKILILSDDKVCVFPDYIISGEIIFSSKGKYKYKVYDQYFRVIKEAILPDKLSSGWFFHKESTAALVDKLGNIYNHKLDKVGEIKNYKNKYDRYNDSYDISNAIYYDEESKSHIALNIIGGKLVKKVFPPSNNIWLNPVLFANKYYIQRNFNKKYESSFGWYIEKIYDKYGKEIIINDKYEVLFYKTLTSPKWL